MGICKGGYTMKTGLFIRKYKSLYFVEFCNASVGITLLVTESKEEAEKELSRLKSLDKKQFIKEITQCTPC